MKKILLFDIIIIIFTIVALVYYWIKPTDYGFAVLAEVGKMIICFIALVIEVIVLVIIYIKYEDKKYSNHK